MGVSPKTKAILLQWDSLEELIAVTLTHHNEVPLLIRGNTYMRTWGIT